MGRILITILLGLILYSPAKSDLFGGYLKIKGELSARKTSGSTLLHLTIPFYQSTYGSTKFESEIECPLDAFMAGGKISFIGKLKGRLNWSLNLKYHTNLQDPASPTTDSDWERVPGIGFDELYSFTESKNKLKAKAIDVYASFDVVNNLKFSLGFSLGFKYLKYDFKAMGLTGFYNYFDTNYVLIGEYYISAYKGELVGINEFTYHVPYMGVYGEINVLSTVVLGGNFGYSPITLARDYDDHVLRNKEGRGKCRGTTLLASGNVEWYFWEMMNGSSISFKLGYEYMDINTTGEQTQTFYGDDPGTEDEDETGLTFGDLDYDLKSNQTAVTFSVTGRL